MNHRAGFLTAVFLGVSMSVGADVITLQDGGRIEGRIVSENGDQVTVELRGGKVTCSRASVAAIDQAPFEVAPAARPKALDPRLVELDRSRETLVNLKLRLRKAEREVAKSEREMAVIDRMIAAERVNHSTSKAQRSTIFAQATAAYERIQKELDEKRARVEELEQAIRTAGEELVRLESEGRVGTEGTEAGDGAAEAN